MSDKDPIVRDAPVEVYLTVRGAKAAIEFYQRAFDAEATFRMAAEDGERLMHANLRLFGAEVMLSDEFEGADAPSPSTLGGSGVTIHINLSAPEAVNVAMAKAEAAGAVITMPAQDQFWGARYGRLRDPFGHMWAFAAPLPPGESNA